ncbi:MAG: NAD-dependent dehydratase [Deltaproteobacteria bacterium RIFCSPLOWO2_12_FULL_40_28]|nr:MAG: NAD-dependent dehydratase [Deltaproteobacteria bacterium RIFCSPHIGHO2_02_FULL_40_28]OGQ20703.1 MAG: NAD-dependent dehydratase [Deltaproteobacteria bacterium RIFCSPHIGHO2_12_FULL_40_32]OGQ38938.1 MAG: NAD-dependent dehydratase [Deltaproteobacteria bacterium RIFCSPLOWO2_02_FULL_40_36]OGQ55298.1 MAG: NAD-dependent dehydratase [Deltaproteobacteria bacterium RIFCSPLOWO2_12_FULL_40_28]
MKPLALVTGATGFIGNAVARTLLKSERTVRVLIRKNSDRTLLNDLDVEIFEGDLRYPESLNETIRGCAELYHVAAQYTFFNPKPDEIYSSNVQGTHNILSAALTHCVSRVVYTSTVGAIGIPHNQKPGDENTQITIADCRGHYKRSKFLAEQEALNFFKKGLPVVIVNPSAPIGVRDIKPTPTGKMILDFLNRKMPAYMDTGLNLVDVEDVATGHLLASEKGKPGERYILGNQNLSLQEILQLLSELTGLSAPKIKVPYSLALGSAYLSEAWARFTKQPPLIEIEAVKLGKKMMFFNPQKAIRELGLPQTPVKIALKKAVDWYVTNGYVKKEIQERLGIL